MTRDVDVIFQLTPDTGHAFRNIPPGIYRAIDETALLIADRAPHWEIRITIGDLLTITATPRRGEHT